MCGCPTGGWCLVGPDGGISRRVVDTSVFDLADCCEMEFFDAVSFWAPGSPFKEAEAHAYKEPHVLPCPFLLLPLFISLDPKPCCLEGPNTCACGPNPEAGILCPATEFPCNPFAGLEFGSAGEAWFVRLPAEATCALETADNLDDLADEDGEPALLPESM